MSNAYPPPSQEWNNSYYVPVRGSAYTEPATPNSLTLVDPYVVETLKTVIGKMLVINTGDGTVRGRLKSVKPDHVVVQEPEGRSTFFIRIQKIVWIMPD